MATRNDMTNLVAYMKLAFSNYNPVIDGRLTTIDVLEDLLGDLPYPELQVAVQACCLESGRAFAPSPGEIRGKYTDLNMQAAGTLTGGECWAEITGSMTRMPAGNLSGGGHTGHLDDANLRQAVNQMGGFDAIAQDIDAGNGMASRAHFLRIYQQVVDDKSRDIAQHPQITDYLEDKKQLTNQSMKQLADKFGGR